MTTMTRISLDVAPRVDLLPPEIAVERRFARLRLALGATVLASAAVVGVAYVHTVADRDVAAQQLDAARAQNTALTAQASQLAYVPSTYAEVDAAKAKLAAATAKDVRWSFYLDSVSRSLPQHVWLQTMTISKADASAAPTSTGSVPLYSVAFSGTAYAHDDVASWLDSLARQKGNADPSLSTSTLQAGNPKTVTFESSVSVTSDALSHRYTDKAGE